MTDELTTVLPAWVPWVGPGLALTSLVAMYLCVKLILVDGSFRSITDDMDWTERARRVHVARRGAGMAVVLLPVAGVAVAHVFVGGLAVLPRAPIGLGLAVLGAIAGISLSASVDRRIHGPSDEGRLHSVAGPVMAYSPVLLLIVLGWFAPNDVATWWMVPWALVVVRVVWLWLRAPLLMLSTPLATDADTRAVDIVERASTALGVAVDRIIEIRTRQPNAFAFPWLGVVAFTTGLLGVLDDDELEAITHHELAHLAESAGLTRLRQAQFYALIPIVASRPLIGSLGLAGPVAALALFVGVSEFVRRRGLGAEHTSDAAAIDAIHHSAVYGRALEKTYRIGLIPAVLRRATHGHLYERLQAAGVDPNFEPPPPPSRLRPFVAMTGVVLSLTVTMFSPWIAFAATGADSLVFHQVASGIPFYGSEPLQTLAFGAELDERWSDAAILYEAAAKSAFENVYLRTEAVRLWAYAGECARANASADHIDGETDTEDLVYARDLVEWCELTGGLPPG